MDGGVGGFTIKENFPKCSLVSFLTIVEANLYIVVQPCFVFWYDSFVYYLCTGNYHVIGMQLNLT